MDDVNVIIEEAFNTYADSIFRYIFLRLKDRERALELTHDIFVRVYEYLQKGKKIEFMKSFLFQSAHNVFINEIRTKKRLLSLESLQETGFDPVGEDREDIESFIDKKFDQQKVVELLGLLDDTYKEVLLLRYVEGFAIKEIAEMLEEKENAISVRIHRGIQKLKELYN